MVELTNDALKPGTEINDEQIGRVRMNLSQNSKGMFQMECSVESETVEKSKDMLKEAITAMKEVVASEGLKLAH